MSVQVHHRTTTHYALPPGGGGSHVVISCNCGWKREALDYEHADRLWYSHLRAMGLPAPKPSNAPLAPASPGIRGPNPVENNPAAASTTLDEANQTIIRLSKEMGQLRGEVDALETKLHDSHGAIPLMIDRIVASLRDYPKCGFVPGGDQRIMAEVDRIVAEAVAATNSAWKAVRHISGQTLNPNAFRPADSGLDLFQGYVCTRCGHSRDLHQHNGCLKAGCTCTLRSAQ